ncbi:unnamed protein product [Dracunculus medinensis]|uniref:Kunitz/Bovine pancreatic trypsin inhibitor domain protein n=1 Tax=Dracunculus medinensis TaxID=318479 RepID=A0A0N4UBV3_DRAME|nr:unnamed protein product [Dracunculus medinensis]
MLYLATAADFSDGVLLIAFRSTVVISRCDSPEISKKSDPNDTQSYFICDAQGKIIKKKCPSGMSFNNFSTECAPSLEIPSNDDPFFLPHYQAPDDICDNGIPLTRLGAPVICNPLISSCPDGYACARHRRTNLAYCCKITSDELSQKKEHFCPNDQVTYIEQSSGVPKSCDMSQIRSCPMGFVCTMITNSITRCCGKNLGCPFNSAGLVDLRTSSYVSCSLTNERTCQPGFQCVMSSMFAIPLCCSTVDDDRLKSVCLVGSPNPSNPVHCMENDICRKDYQCTRSGNQQYCCPAPENICRLPNDPGIHCSGIANSAVTRFYFDMISGSCRSFNYKQCGGNDNNFKTLNQCQEFCQSQQCPAGIAQQLGNINTACSLERPIACQEGYACRKPLFGPGSICCPKQEKVCNEVVTAGTDCFTKSISVKRFYYNSAFDRCESFEYFGCSGNNNNFLTREQCENSCNRGEQNACNGATPLMDPSNRLQICSEKFPCPSGYACNNLQHCCPTPGCAGTANRFTDQNSCEAMCLERANLGQCPLGMSPLMLPGRNTPKTCTIGAAICPEKFSCVHSTRNVKICCQTKAECPYQRKPYLISGSDSMVSCRVDENNCPNNSECLESSIRGFFICCLRDSNDIYHQQQIRTMSECPDNIKSNGKICTPNTIGGCSVGYTCIKQSGLSTGFCCAIQPKCLRGKTEYIVAEQVIVLSIWYCLKCRQLQAKICGREYDECPKSTACFISSVPSISVCCHLASSLSPPRFFSTSPSSVCFNGRTPFYEIGSQWPKQCLLMQRNQCPSQFTCQPSKTGGLFYCCPVSPNECLSGRHAYVSTQNGLAQDFIIIKNPDAIFSCQPSADRTKSLCCMDQVALAKCPAGSSAYIYGNRPLACPVGSIRCPNGYSCTRSDMQNVYLCCSTSLSQIPPTCLQGMPYIDPVRNMPQICSQMNPLACPPGYYCSQSTVNGQYVCCINRQLNPTYMGFCPIGMVPYITRQSPQPNACHMTLLPCPNMAQFTCIYSAEKQDSFCCAPIETFMQFFSPALRPQAQQIATDISGCPFGSQPLINLAGQLQQCNPSQCPASFTCHFAIPFNRWQCCSIATNILHRKSPKFLSECESGHALINGRCMQLFYIGQKGCQINEQCSTKLLESRCENNYCKCPRNKLIHQSKCVTNCPDGFIDIAARCHDLTTIVFMDSVDNRENGTIGGFCKSTVVEDEQCDVADSFCNEKSITCQCKPGFELKMDFDNKNDRGKCIKLEDSIFADGYENSKQITKTEFLNNSTNIDGDFEYIMSLLFQSD